jgi:hypothetical protein
MPARLAAALAEEPSSEPSWPAAGLICSCTAVLGLEVLSLTVGGYMTCYEQGTAACRSRH